MRVRDVSDRLAQRQDSLDRGVAGRTLVERLLGGVPDEFRRVEIGFTRAEVDDLASLSLEGARPLRDCDRRRLLSCATLPDTDCADVIRLEMIGAIANGGSFPASLLLESRRR
jgi:hypothetical protein